MINHPPHYQTRAVECVVATRGMGNDLGQCVGYVYRAWDKGQLVQDLEKARWWLKDHMAHKECQLYPPSGNAMDACRRIAAGCDPKTQARERAFFYAIAAGLYGDALQNIEWMIADVAEQD